MSGAGGGGLGVRSGDVSVGGVLGDVGWRLCGEGVKREVEGGGWRRELDLVGWGVRSRE